MSADVATQVADEAAISEIEEPPLDGEFDTSTESADVEAQVADETAVSETEEPTLDGEFGTSTDSADVETQVAIETAVSETEEPALVGEFDTSTEGDVETQARMRLRFRNEDPVYWRVRRSTESADVETQVAIETVF